MRHLLFVCLLYTGVWGVSLSYAKESSTQQAVPETQASVKTEQNNEQKTHKAVPMNEFSRKLLEYKIKQYHDYFGNNDE